MKFAVSRVFRHFQKRLQRQVILEAKIMEVTSSDGYQQGISWSNLSKSTRGGVVIDRPGGTLPPLDAISSLLGGQTNGSFQMAALKQF